MSQRRHETTVGGVTAYAQPWLQRENCWTCELFGRGGASVLVDLSWSGGALTTVAAQGQATADLRVLAAVLQEAAEIAETGEVPL